MKSLQILLPFFLLGAVNAQVTVDDTGSAIGSGTFTNADLGDGLVDFDPTGSDKIVVAFVDEGGSPTAISYAGTPLQQAIFRQNTQRSDIWYADFPSGVTPGNLVVTGGSSPFGVSIWALSNTADGFVAKASAGATSIDFDPLHDGSAVIAAVASNSDGDAIAQSPLTPLQNATSLGGGARGGSGWVVTNAGVDTFPFNVPSPNRPTLTVVSFAAIGVDVDTAGIVSVSAVDEAGNPTSSLLTDAVLTLNFDEAILPGTGSILLKKDGGTTAQTYDVNSASQLSFVADRLTITPDILEPSTSYFIQIPSGAIEDGSGNTTSYPDTTLTFTTGPWLTVAAGFKTTYSTADLRNFDPTGYDKLVVIVMDEGNDFPTGVTWGSSSTFTPIINNANSIRRSSMWYLDGPFTGPESLTVSGIGNSHGVSLLALSGTAAGDPAASANASADSINFTTTSTDSIVVAGITDNGAADISAASPLGTYFTRDVSSSAGGSGVAANSTIGSQAFSFTGATSSPSLVIAEFVKAGAPSFPYNTWADLTFGAGTLTDKTATGDDDNDNLSNLLEFAFGSDPTVADAGSLDWDGSTVTPGTPVVLHSFPGGGGVDFKARFIRRVDHGDPGSVDYAWRFSSDLNDWESSADTPSWYVAPGPALDTFTGADGITYELLEIPYPFQLDNNKKARFFQVEVTEVAAP